MNKEALHVVHLEGQNSGSLRTKAHQPVLELVVRPSMRPPVPPFPRFYGRRAKLFPSPIPELDWSANGHSAESSDGRNKRERQQKGKDGLTFFAAWAAGGKIAAAQNGMGSEL